MPTPFHVTGQDRTSGAALWPFFRVVAAVFAAAIAASHTGVAAEPLPRGDASAAATPGEELTRLADTLAARAAALPVLEGGTLDLNFDDLQPPAEGPRRYAVTRVVDPARADQQRAAMDALLREVVPPGRFRIDASKDREFPYSALAAHLRDLIRTDPRFPGCAFLGGNLRIVPESEDLKFWPRFEVARDGQFKALIDECRDFLRRSGKTADVLVMDDDAAPDKKGRQQKMADWPQDPDVNEIFRELQEATRRDVALHGAAIQVEYDKDVPDIAPKGYEFQLTADDARAAELSMAAERIARRLIPSGRFRFNTKTGRTLPVSSVLDRIQQEIDVDPRFAGCSVSHMSLGYSSDGSQIDVVIHGRVLKASQAEQIADLARRLMRREPAWNMAEAVLQTAGREDLVVTPPSPALAARYYGLAMNHFYASNYEEADKLLALASIEDPNNIVYRYWRVLGLMARGDTAAAEERLARTVRGFGIRPYSPDHVAAMRAIYRIQGSLRHELIDMENRVMAAGSRAVPLVD